ncbi:MAG: S8 family serine peptidase [Acidobacteriota bacterium]|nr:S8 family serine peptidase [Acidobacteriota bacterium]
MSVIRSNGITLTGADGVRFIGTNGITLTGADGFLNRQANGITLTGADGITLTGADGITLTGADASVYTGTNGITLTGADGITLTGADGITLTGADGITLTGADGTTYRVDSVIGVKPNGITLTGADGITLTGADGITLTGADGITLTGADGITLTGADGITLTGADSILCVRADGTTFSVSPNGITLTGADGITLTGADGINLNGTYGVNIWGNENYQTSSTGLQSVSPELALFLNQATDDSTVNAVVVYHQYPSETDLNHLRQIGILGGTRFKQLPMVVVTGTRQQIISISRLSNVRSIYGNRSLNFDSDPYFNVTGIRRVTSDRDLQQQNSGLPVSGRNVTVAVLDTGVNSLHNDLSNRVVQNVRLADLQSAPLGFVNPIPTENVPNTDLVAGHGTFVSGIIAGNGTSSGGRYNGVAPGANILGLSAGDINLTYVLAGFDYLLDRGAAYNTRVVNCSFSANTVFDFNDPVNIATKILTDRGISVVFSTGNTGAGNGTLNPYAAAPWVISVGATDEKGKLASFSSRSTFGNQFRPTVVAPGVNVVGLRSLPTMTSILGVVGGSDLQRLSLSELPFYTTASGTSFSAPQVAGAIALMLETNPNLTPKQIKEILQRTATPLPPYFAHEVGAGMLNVHAAVLESALPNRKTGFFRSVLERRAVNFYTSTTQTFKGLATPGTPVQMNVQLPPDAIQATVSIAWGDIFSLNDLGLKVNNSNGSLYDESNYLNSIGLTGRREKVTINNPSSPNWSAIAYHTGALGTPQDFFGVVETTRAEIAPLADINSLYPGIQATVRQSLRSFVMLPEGKSFRPSSSVMRSEMAAALLRGGRVPQYVAAAPLYSDVHDLTTRELVESVQSSPNGKLFVDANTGGAFNPYAPTTRLIAAVALVKAAGYENLVATTPLTTPDALSVPSQYRGYVAVALRKGLLVTQGANFNGSRALTRLELAQAMVRLTQLAIE